ncbi:FkbM family methyltransferase [Pedobacter heparinus]|uniref:FkbM family methyltransferase n=1 Tax=Pedobacter heparinus TaxID=984 RepID=UPI00292D7D12|nr:FkbM family methyltransferase [Pedobacter heparinus]
MNKFKRTFGFIFSHPLGRKHPIKSLFRFALWQVQCILYPSRLLIKKFLPPVKYYARKGLTGITGNIYIGLHEFEDMLFMLHFLIAKDNFIDIGANVGSYTLLASGISGAKSIAIEPVQATFELLNKNILLNNLQDRVVLYNAGAGSIPGTLAFTSDQDTTNHVLTPQEEQKNNITYVPILVIDSLFIADATTLIKIDVEGYETEVLKGMSVTLRNPALKAIIIELNGSGERYGFTDMLIHELFIANSFKSYTYDPFKRLLTEREGYGIANTIYCRDLGFVNNRIKNAKAIRLMGETI